MFYYVLQKAHEPEKLYDPVDLKAIRKPGDLWKYFRKVLDVNYTPIFGFDVASRLPSRRDVVEKVREVVRMVLSLAQGEAWLREQYGSSQAVDLPCLRGRVRQALSHRILIFSLKSIDEPRRMSSLASSTCRLIIRGS